MLQETDVYIACTANLVLLLETGSQKTCTRMVKLIWDINPAYNFSDSIQQERFYSLLETVHINLTSWLTAKFEIMHLLLIQLSLYLSL